MSKKQNAIEGKQLTPREIDILEAATRGLSTPEIAKSLELTPGTVHTYKKRMYKKLGVGSMLAAVQLWTKRSAKIPLDPELEMCALEICKFAEGVCSDVLDRESLSRVITRAADISVTRTKPKRLRPEGMKK